MYDGVDCYGCPLRNIDSGAHELLALYPHYKQGILYCGGGLRAQPYKYVRAMQVIAGEFGKIEQDRRERNEQLRKTGGEQ